MRPRRPNVVLITSDQHNAEILGCAGNPVVRTPNLDALAREGVLFPQAFTSFPICTPARTTIFTGLYARRHGVRHNVNMNYQPGPPALPAERKAFPETLREAGYDTSFFGKLHTRHEGGRNFGLSVTRLVEGKCHFVGSPHEMDEYRRHLLARGYPPDIWKVWENDPRYARDGYVTSPLPDRDYVDTFIADMALEYLAKAQRPLFTWVSFCTPHNPWDPPQPYDAMYDPAQIPMPHRRRGELEEKPPQWVDRVAQTIPALASTSLDRALPVGTENAYKRFPEEKTRRMLAAYYGQVSHLDAQVGRLMGALKARGMYEDTVILFTADHGDYCGNNWAFYKYEGLYDSLIRVPMIVRWPGAGSGRVAQGLASLVDIMPTILDAAGALAPGAQCPAGLDGRSLRPLMEGECADWREDLVVESGGTRALLTPEWKLVRWNNGTEELYDRRRDPHDLANLGKDPALESVRARLRARLQAWVEAR